MSNSGVENRRYERVNVKYLPENLQTLIINLNPAEKIEVSLTDASINGVGFITDADPSNFITATNIILYPVDEAYPIFGKIVFTRTRENKRTRVGIEIKKTAALEKYRKIIDEILKKQT